LLIQLRRGLDARLRVLGVKHKRECGLRAELDMQILVCTRGRAFPLARLAERLRCPRCGSRRGRGGAGGLERRCGLSSGRDPATRCRTRSSTTFAARSMCSRRRNFAPAGRVSRSDFQGSPTGGRMRAEGRSMIRHLFVLAVTLAVLPAVAVAQGGGAQGHLGTPEQQRACRPDVQRFCREMQNQRDYAIADCLKANGRRLSSACRRVIEAGSR
jgi:hypothetical protein